LREEICGGRALAAVVANLQKGHWLKASGGEHGALAGGFGVALEQEGRPSILKSKDERIVIRRCAVIAVAGLGREHSELRASPREGVACVEVTDGYTELFGFL
jgi:hypothetical protein